jgi:hypothetical protein
MACSISSPSVAPRAQRVAACYNRRCATALAAFQFVDIHKEQERRAGVTARGASHVKARRQFQVGVAIKRRLRSERARRISHGG